MTEPLDLAPLTADALASDPRLAEELAGSEHPLMLLPVRLGLGGPLGGGRQTLSWVHVEDVVRGMAHVWSLAAAQTGPVAPQAYNFTAPGAVSQGEFMRTATVVLRRPFWLPTPALPMRLALGEQADVLLEGQRVAPARLLQTGIGQYLEITHNLYGFTRPSSYTKRPTTQEQAIDLEERQTYLIVYPFSKTTEWFLMSRDARQGMMNEHMRIGLERRDRVLELGVADRELPVAQAGRRDQRVEL